MTQNKHTPLPWVIIQADTERLEIDQELVRASGAILIGKYGYRMTIEGRTCEEEFVANLHLIAAAPKLLKALEMVSNFNWRNNRTHLLEIVNAAIAEAIERGTV